MDAIRLVELFAGVGAFSKALTNLKIPHKTVAICEIDKHAIRAHEAIHGPTTNLGDISAVDSLPECDLLTYSFPCQDLSVAGLRAGMDKGTKTRSSLLWQVERLLTDAKGRDALPEYLVMENVDAITHKANLASFATWRAALTSMGYTSSYQIMDASDYGVPQRRRRCFMVSRLGYKQFIFPDPCPDGRVLMDILEAGVPDKYFLSDKATLGLKVHKMRHDARGNGFGFKITNPAGVAGCVTAKAGWRNTDTFILDEPAPPGAGVLADCPLSGHKPRLMQVATLDTNYERMGRVYGLGGLYCALTTNPTTMPTIMADARIRRLTPRECWELQGMGDAYEMVTAIGLSDARLYQQAGNSIAVPVAEAIFRAMFIDCTWIGAPTLEGWA